MTPEHENDIAVYVQGKLHTEDDSVKSQIREKAGGVFSWVVFAVAVLNAAYNEGKSMQKTLDNVALDLPESFGTLLENVNSDHAESIKMLQ
ncbi:putative ankyrin repeat domain-containing protein [Rosellinia necatrix]|uniref:Putative ankyrin repeat domain-containing protein n=1 Tax=Rosellinia necatrix TaxID=77044 RepID=A0A1S8A9Q2_ROSNE|nr:putative ankyrin repeat domain-containing protein [Rosellinia necatrix]